MKKMSYKLVIFTPLTHADIVREALGKAGAGIIGNYEYCSFSSIGYGRYRGNEKSNPTIGIAGNYEKVEEERIEVVVNESVLKDAIAEVKKVHPYEEVAFDIYKLENF
jgi:hypothetical protein